MLLKVFGLVLMDAQSEHWLTSDVATLLFFLSLYVNKTFLVCLFVVRCAENLPVFLLYLYDRNISFEVSFINLSQRKTTDYRFTLWLNCKYYLFRDLKM